MGAILAGAGVLADRDFDSSFGKLMGTAAIVLGTGLVGGGAAR